MLVRGCGRLCYIGLLCHVQAVVDHIGIEDFQFGTSNPGALVSLERLRTLDQAGTPR